MLQTVRLALVVCLAVMGMSGHAANFDLAQVRESGVLRHLGVRYANFVTGAGDGLDVELMRGFATDLGVRYEFVPTTWEGVFGDLTGTQARRHGDGAERFGKAPVRGDVVANGMTVLGFERGGNTLLPTWLKTFRDELSPNADDATFERIRPVLDCWAGVIVHLGPVGSGHKMKLINNFIAMGYAALYAEALALALPGVKVIEPQVMQPIEV